MAWLILGFQAAAFGVLSAIVANKKGRDGFQWFVIGFLFGIFGFIAALVVEDSNPSRHEPRVGPFDSAEADKRCPRCAEGIKAQASVCRHCGQTFEPEQIVQAVTEAQTVHNAVRTKQWLRDLPKPKRSRAIDAIAKEAAHQRLIASYLPPARLGPEEWDKRTHQLQRLPDEDWVRVVSVAIHDI